MSRVLLLVLMLSACATTPNALLSPSGRVDGPASRQVHTDLVREMIAQGRYYAALAHIEELQKRNGPRDELLLLHARVLARLDRNEQAESEYRQLLGSAYEGEARHGLGLLYARQNHRISLEYLKQAARLRPTDPDIRNDYGYALLTGGQYPVARLELATAFELASNVDKYRNNYVLSLLLFKDEAEIRRIAQRSGLSDKTLENLRAQAAGWPAVVQRTLKAAAAIPDVQSQPTPPQTASDRNSVKRKLGVPGAN